MNILIVDDEPDILALWEISLRVNNFQVVTAGSGEEAIARAKQGGIDLVILDYFLPDIDGAQVCEAVRKEPGCESLPIIFVTASKEVIKELPNIEHTEKYLKPVETEKLIESINRLAA
ncbi:MAG: response regulator [Simkaniaceae bacterium]|nr:response regulator [Simkaniaceae bacterium]